MRRHCGISWHPLFNVFLTGLVVAQIVSMAQVYWSNIHLYENAVILHNAGYLEIPTLDLLQKLKSSGPAIFGGLFFTLTVGAGLTLATIGAIWIWHFLSMRSRHILALWLIVWAGALFLLNIEGLNLFASLHFLMVPAAVALAYLHALAANDRRKGFVNRLLPLYPLAFLAVIWGSQADSRLFVDIRDYLLLSNPAGRAFNRYYYRYTLYPAEAFKSLDQKLQRTTRLEGPFVAGLRDRLASVLTQHDYLVVKTTERVDLLIRTTGKDLAWFDNGEEILRISPAGFLADPSAVLREFSGKTDRGAFFRTFTFFCILFAFPIILYIGFYGGLRLLAGLCMQPFPATLFAGCVCFIAGTALLVPVYLGSHRSVSADNLATALNSADWRDRVAALKLIEKAQMEITANPGYRQLLFSRHLPVRYWLARALSVSRDERTVADLLNLLDDSQPNVVCQALYALGKRGRQETRETILAKIRSSGDWYVQRYGYVALRSVGWRQPVSN